MKPYKKQPRKPLFSDEKQGEIFLSLIKDEIYRKVAKCLFIDGLTNEETAFEIGYCVRQIERIRKDTLEVVLKMLVEMHTPKKPKILGGRYWGRAKSGTCPVCQSGVNSKENQYCKHCGQALDWGN